MSKSLIIIIIVILAGTAAFFLLPKGQETVKDSNLPVSTNEMANLNSQTSEFAGKIAVLETSLGDITLEFYPSDAPKAVENFIRLAEKGYYDGVTFHRVVKDFVIQAGDPTGTGAGGESAFGAPFEDELNPETESYKRGYKKGVVAMANRGPNTNTSQFFIMLQDNPLPHLYTIFGRVIKGLDVVDRIGEVAVDSNDRPLEDVVIKKVIIKDKSTDN